MSSVHQIGHFGIEGTLGSGRNFDVYRAYDQVRKRTVALKELKSPLISNGESVQVFLDGAYRASDLVHPHIAWVWETGEWDGGLYLVERFVDGTPLSQILASSGPLPWLQVQEVITQIAQGLDFAHKRGWVHADVSTEEILYSHDLGAVLIGFGLQGGLSAISRPTLAAPRNRAPELWEGGHSSPESDQYALACVMVELLLGKPLFEAPTQAEIKASHLGDLNQLQSFSEQLPWQLFPAVKRALAREPSRRYSSMTDFAQAPQRLVAETGEESEERSRYEEQARAWREAVDQARHQTEEAARLAAVDQARREIQDQLRLELDSLEVIEGTKPPQAGDQPSPPPLDISNSVPSSRRKLVFAKLKRPWLMWLFLLGLALVLGILWLGNTLATGGYSQSTATSSPMVLLPSVTLTQTPLPTASHSPSLTSTSTSTITITPSVTSTRTHTLTSSPTFTKTPTVTMTPSRTLDLVSTNQDPERRKNLITP